MAEYVLDPAIACKWFLPTGQEPFVIESRVLLDRIAKGNDVAHVPAAFLYELGAWLHHQGVRFNLDPERAFNAVKALPLREYSLDRELASGAHLAASRFKVDFTTAVYLALAEKCICPYLTPDNALAERLSGQARIATLGAAL